MPERKLSAGEFIWGNSVFEIIYIFVDKSRFFGNVSILHCPVIIYFRNIFSQVERRRRPSKDSESETDSDDSDLDLDKKLKPMATYVKQRDVLVEQMFHCISKKKLKRMLPEILKYCSTCPV